MGSAEITSREKQARASMSIRHRSAALTRDHPSNGPESSGASPPTIRVVSATDADRLCFEATARVRGSPPLAASAGSGFEEVL